MLVFIDVIATEMVYYELNEMHTICLQHACVIKNRSLNSLYVT